MVVPSPCPVCTRVSSGKVNSRSLMESTIVDSIRDRLFTLPEDTRVHTGHGDGTTIGTEAPHLAEWIARGH